MGDDKVVDINKNKKEIPIEKEEDSTLNEFIKQNKKKKEKLEQQREKDNNSVMRSYKIRKKKKDD